MKLGYARVSTDDQTLDRQRERLREAGCERLFEEKMSGARRDRPELARLLDQLRKDDVVDLDAAVGEHGLEVAVADWASSTSSSCPRSWTVPASGTVYCHKGLGRGLSGGISMLR